MEGLSARADEPQMKVLHASEHLLVLDKPAGLLSVPGRGPDMQDCASARARRMYPDALVVHRLDMSTSGLLLMARGAEMQRRLGDAFANRQVHKRYEAVVSGHLVASCGTIDLPLAADWPNRPRQVVDYERGRPSRTVWRALDGKERTDAHTHTDSTRLELEPVTGRSHQLRVHLKAIGHPILGDALYAPPHVHARAPRLMLHATQLSLEHPATGEPLSFHSPAPF